MTLSIIISTHNRAQLLRETLDQLRRQQFEAGDELIVVDNASTDDTPDVIAAAATNFPVPVRHLYEPRPGKSFAMNQAIGVATGDIFALTDDDVLVADDWLATMRTIFHDREIALVGGRVDPRWERPAPAWLRVHDGIEYGGIAAPLALLHYGPAQPLRDRTAVGANIGVRRDVLEAIGGFAPYLGRSAGTLLCGEDYDLCARAIGAGFRCDYRPELRVDHWVPAERLSLRYFLRWFFWSGITEVVLERTVPWPHVAPPARRNLPREVIASLGRSLAARASGRQPDAALHLMEAACALGRMTQHVREWWTGTRHSVNGRTPDRDRRADPSNGGPRAGDRQAVIERQA